MGVTTTSANWRANSLLRADAAMRPILPAQSANRPRLLHGYHVNSVLVYLILLAVGTERHERSFFFEKIRFHSVHAHG